MPAPDISKAEWRVMNALWKLKKTTAREVAESLSAETGWSYNTVKTLLVRLCEKDWAREDKVGGTCFYRPAVARRSAVARAIDDLVERVLDGAREPLVNYLGKGRRLTEDELVALEEVLRRHREGKR